MATGKNDIAIGWVKLAALEGSQCRQDCGIPWGFFDLLPGMRWNEYHAGCAASLSGIFTRGVGRKKKVSSAIPPPVTSLPMVPYIPPRGTYAYEALHRKFKEFDLENQGYISEGDLKAALKDLNLPASEKGVRNFLAKIEDTARPLPVSFENFLEYTIQQENELVHTFKELDRWKTGYISFNDMRTALHKYRFSSSEKPLKKMINRFTLRGGKAEPVIDYAEYKNILMISTYSDLRDPCHIWERAYTDLDNVDCTFPLSSGTICKTGCREQQGRKQQVERHLIDAALCSSVSRSVVAPLERLKLLSMVNLNYTKDGLPATFAKIWNEDGITGFFRGNLLNVVSIAPTKVVEYLVYTCLEDFMKNKNDRNVGDKEKMLMGSIATMSGTFVSHPIDTVRTALAVQVNGAQKGILKTTQAILDRKGLWGLYQGVIPNMIRVAPYAAINFVLYDELKKWYHRRTGPGGELGLLSSIFCGVLSGAAAQVALYPLETVQRHLQAHAAEKSSLAYQNMFDALRIIIQDGGVSALYAGLLPSTLKLVPAAAVSILVYEALQRKGEYKHYRVK
ncbi:hypothetical protein KP509_18G032100 [Ceratopteris richardii]|uniref:EF-hand domain-containing protein n=1 Tax=Ceratopteris richardii TaxID=49495 RepID=A0A8T2SQK6_CERRI|nr:hypothetical protein KP509_18G032100 [Ceratopteris richardii]